MHEKQQLNRQCNNSSQSTVSLSLTANALLANHKLLEFNMLIQCNLRQFMYLFNSTPPKTIYFQQVQRYCCSTHTKLPQTICYEGSLIRVNHRVPNFVLALIQGRALNSCSTPILMLSRIIRKLIACAIFTQMQLHSFM